MLCATNCAVRQYLFRLIWQREADEHQQKTKHILLKWLLDL